jgi:hypothetical protein
MKTVANVFLTLMLLLGLAASSMLAASDATTPVRSSSITIGQFAVAVAKAMDDAPETQATLSPEKALATLKESGLGFSVGSDAVLTQAEFAAFLRHAGVQVSVPSPDLPISLQQAKTAISGFGSLFASRGSKKGHGNTTSTSSGSGGGDHSDKGHDPLPASFDQCAVLDKVPDCRACCLALGLGNHTCGKACGQANAAQNVSPHKP